MITRVSDVISQLKETSTDVRDLMRQLKTPVPRSRREIIEDQLRQEFETALMETVPRGIMISLASVLAHSTVYDITTIGETIVVYIRCKTVKAQHELLHTITSGFMKMAFDDVMKSQTCTPISVDACAVCRQCEGWLFDV